MAHLNKGCELDIDHTNLEDTMHHFDGTLQISVLDALHQSEPKDTSDAALAGAGSANWSGSHAIATHWSF
jgi:hypothetical protein